MLDAGGFVQPVKDSGALGRGRGDGTEKVREEALSPLHRAVLRLGDAARGTRARAGTATAVPASPPLPPLPAPLRLQSPMAAAARREPAQTHTCAVAARSHQSQHVLHQAFLLSGCWHVAENEEAPAKQSISVQSVSQVRTPKASVSPWKAHPCEICGPDLRDIFHLTEHQGTHCGQNIYRIRACEKQLCLHAKLQHQKQCTGETCLRSSKGRASLVKDCKSCVSGKPLSCEEVVRDVVAGSRFLQHQATHTREESNRRSECGAAFHGGNTQYNSGKCTKDFDCKRSPW
ncbi:hypothetical protein HPG69_007244 [Diceros bicornis minor]|uniref:C2H2-type domain-containing protein n=1 Tax=Diceros bicornis minor TaxID=77932 RepID=A0A7J7FNF3_DICBM|nr:hypothetical protein HPG69_007244 [Diceros bicornis minor]